MDYQKRRRSIIDPLHWLVNFMSELNRSYKAGWRILIVIIIIIDYDSQNHQSNTYSQSGEVSAMEMAV